MLGINCLLDNIDIKSELKQLIDLKGWEIAAEGKSPSIQAVFRALRKDGLEIDAQTLSHLYEDVFGSHPLFSTQTEIDDFRNDTYRKLIDAEAELMKAKEIGKDSPVTTAVSKLMEQVKLMGENVPSLQRLFQDRLMKAAKKVTGFSPEKSDKNKTAENILKEVLMLEQNNSFNTTFGAMENAERLWTEFRKEFMEMADILEQKDDVYNAEKIRQYADILEGATYRFLMSAAEAQQVIKETLQEAGYVKEVTVKGEARKITDWNKIFADTDFDFRKTIKDTFRPKGFSEKELDRIAEEMQVEYNKVRDAKIEAELNRRNKESKSKTSKSAIQKLQQLYQVGIFESANQRALFKVLGIPDATQKQIDQLQQLMQVNNKAMQSPVEQWSPTYLKTIQREIEIIIEQAEENKSFLLNAIRKFSFFNQLNNALLLSNPQNVTENVLSGAFQTMITTVFTQPKEAGKSLKVLYDVFLDVVKGGVREGQEMTNTFNSSGNYEDRYNFETAETGGQKVKAFLGMLPRVFLSSFDNAYKASIIHQVATDVVKNELIRQGANSREADLILNETLYGNTAEIEKIAKQLQDNLNASGISVGNQKWKRISHELAWANLISDGEFFQDTLNNLVKSGDVRKELEGININKELLEDVLNAAEIAASKGLGHQADSKMFELLDSLSQYIGRKVSESRRQGRGLAGAEATRALWSQANRFRYGALRWMWLTFEKTSGFALLQTLLTDMIAPAVGLREKKQSGFFNKYKNITIDINPDDAKARKQRAEEIAWYTSLKQRLIRETIGPVFGYATLMLVQSLFSGSGDDDDDKRELLDLSIQMRKDRRYGRWMQKLLPPRAYNYLTELAWMDQFGTLKHKKLSEIELPGELNAVESLYSTTNLLQTFKNNFNDAGMDKLTESLAGMAQDKKGSAAKFGGAMMSVLFSNPLQVYDVYKNAFVANPMLSKKQYEKLKPDGFWEGVIKGSVTQDMWKDYKGVRK